MANIDLKNAAVQKLMLAVLLAGGALGVYFFTHLVPFGFTNNNEKMAGLRGEYEKKSTELARARASVAEEPERTRLYNQMVEVMPGFDDYRRNTTRVIPVIVLTPVK